MNKKVAFLFGAGVSIPCQIPSTKFISDKIFSGENVVRGNAENYFFYDKKKFDFDPYQEFVPRIKTFLSLLKKELQKYYDGKNQFVNYEDIYYLLDFLRKNVYGSEKNPAFEYLFKSFEPTLVSLSKPIDSLINEKVSFERLLAETVRYIESLVFRLLLKKPQNFVSLNLLNQIICDANVASLSIFTLNHDTVIEEFLDSNKFSFCEGFSNEVDGYKFWDSSLFSADNKINLYKLHGSVDWYYYDEDNWVDRRVCKCGTEIIWREPSKPIMLIGTYNKLARYISSIYLELFWLFYKNLNKHNTIIISGYSFGDRGINEKLFDWVLKEGNRMIIIDPFVETLRDKFWSVLYKEWEKREIIIPIKARIEEIDWTNLKNLFE